MSTYSVHSYIHSICVSWVHKKEKQILPMEYDTAVAFLTGEGSESDTYTHMKRPLVNVKCEHSILDSKCSKTLNSS